MRCFACGSVIETITGQLRAADEAATFIHTCPKCPLDASKFTKARKVPHIHVVADYTVKTRLPVLSENNYQTIYVLSLQIKSIDDVSRFNKLLCYNAMGEKGNVFKCHISGPFKGTALKEASRISVAPYANIVSYRSAPCSADSLESQSFIKYRTEENVTYMSSDFETTVISILENDSIDCICAALMNMYLLGHQPTTLKNILSNAKLGTMSNLTARAYDESSADPLEYQFSTKPDGDRIWLTRNGVVWTGSIRLTGHSIKFWTIDNSIPKEYISTYGPCIDLELLHTGLSTNYPVKSHSGSPILIDVLMDEKGNVSRQQRNIEWIYTEFKRLQELFPYLYNIQCRVFRESESEVLTDRLTCGYPTDGIVAIHRNGTDMLKIKSVKSIELKVTEDNTLSTEDNVELFALSEQTYTPGSIVEIKFSILHNKISIESHFIRTDKTTANNYDVICSIMMSVIPKKSPSILRNQLWRWSNMIRTHIYNRASRMSRDKQIIIDVGTGDGQAVESLPPNKSYIFIEQNKESCISLAKRLNMNKEKIHTHPRSIIAHITKMKQGIVKYHIINTTLQIFLNDPVIQNNIKGLVGCCVSSFSAHYVVDCMEILYSLQIPFIGSCYMYDNINVGESIIDSSGLSMTRTSKSTASVTWGKDRIYSEPALEASDIPSGVSITLGVNDVQYVSSDVTDPGYIASRYMKVLIY